MERFLLPDSIPTTGNLPEQWLRFKKQFGQFIDASDKTTANSKTKIAILLRCVGDKGNDIFENFAFPSENPTFEEVIQKFDEFCKPRVSVFASRHQFLTMKQNGLSIDDYITALMKQVRECSFGELKDDMTLHALTLGLDEEKTRRRLFEAKHLTLEKAIVLCRLSEDTEGEMRKLKINEEVNAVYKAKSYGKPRPKPRWDASKTSKPFNKPFSKKKQACNDAPGHSCGKCGTMHAPQQCPAYGKECHRCKRKNHYARFCRSEKAFCLVRDDESDNDVLHIRVEHVDRKLLADVRVMSGGRAQTLKCQLDTAASCNVLSVKDHKALGSPLMTTSHVKLTMYDGTQIESKCRCELQIEVSSEQLSLAFEVVETKHATLLSLDTCLKLQLITVNEVVHLVDSSPKKDVNVLPQEYDDVFTGLGCLPGEYDSSIDRTIQPVQNRLRKVAYALKEDFVKKISSLEEQGVIARVDGPTPWISNCLAIRKPNGAVRICIDPSNLNAAIERNHFPLPTIEEVLPSLKDAKVFSLVDAKDGFLQVKLSEESSYLTTFWTPDGKFRWLRMPFGISSSP